MNPLKKIKYSRIFILGVFLYILFRGLILLIGLKTSVLTLENDFYSMKTRVKAIVVRDEYLIKSDTSGTLSLLVDEGEKVQKLQRVATIYNKNVDNSIEREIYNLKEEIKNIEKNNNSLQIGVLSVKKEQLKIFHLFSYSTSLSVKFSSVHFLFCLCTLYFEDNQVPCKKCKECCLSIEQGVISA